MWIFTQHGFASVAQDKTSPTGDLIVRSPFKGDLERMFDTFGVTITETPNADYRFRCTVPRNVLHAVLGAEINTLSYTKVKPAIDIPSDADSGEIRHEAHLSIFNALLQAGADLTRYENEA